MLRPPSLTLAALCLSAVAGCREPAPDKLPPALVIQDFEGGPSIKRWPKDARGAAAISTAWAADGARSLEIGPGVMASFKDLRRSDWTAYSLLRFTVHNPGPRTASVNLEIQDAHEDFDDRHQHSFGAEPGDHVITLDFSGGLWRGEENRPYRGKIKAPLDVGRVTRLGFTNQGSAPIFIDHLAIEKAAPLATPGGFAFDLGRRGQAVMGQTTGIFPDTVYAPERGYGLVEPVGEGARPMSYPTPLLGDGLPLGRGMRVDLPGGAYLGWIAFERGGFSEDEQIRYRRARVLVNDVTVAEHASSPGGPHFLFEDTELTDLGQIEDKLVRPAHAVTTFRFQAAPGANVFTLQVDDLVGDPLRVAGLILAPDTPAGQAFLAAHEARQREAMAAAYPPLDRSRRSGRSPPAADLVAEPLPLGAQLYPRDYPEHPGGAPPPVADGFPGQAAAAQIALFARRGRDVRVEIGNLVGPGGAPLPAPRISHGRYLPTRPLGNGPVWLEINHYRPGSDFAVGPELARAVLFEWLIPAGAAPGVYTGEAVIGAEGEGIRVPLRVQVHAVTLPPLPIPVGLLMSALPFGPEVVGEDRFWELTAALIEEQARAGLNTLTGGPGLSLRALRRGPEVRVAGERAAFYVALARSRGPVLAAVNYGGFFRQLSVDDASAPAFARAFQAFAARQGLPPFYFSRYDEPGTDDELRLALSATEPLARAGLSTMGFLTRPRDTALVRRLLDVTSAPAMNAHTPADIKDLAARGKQPWAYNNGLDRWGMGIQLWRGIRAGVAGRLEWIGLITQGFAFDNLDGREPATSAFLVHDRLGPMPTPRWLAAREGLTDARVRLALEAAVKADDPALAAYTMDGYGRDREALPDDKLAAARAVMLDRLGRAAP